MESLNNRAAFPVTHTKAPQSGDARSPRTPRKPADEPALRLMALAQSGDAGALDTLLAQARPRAVAVALKVLRNPDDAEDAVQDAFLKVWRYLGRFEGRASFSTWLHRIVMNASLDVLRRGSCRPDTRVDDEEGKTGAQREARHDETPEWQLEHAQTAVLVRGALATLSPVHRQALTLREFEDKSYDEIAHATACPVGTVMSRLHHARRKLAVELRGVDSDSNRRAA